MSFMGLVLFIYIIIKILLLLKGKRLRFNFKKLENFLASFFNFKILIISYIIYKVKR